MNNVINEILQAKSWQELDGVIAKRIKEEKVEFEKVQGRNFIAPPTDNYKNDVNVTDSFLHPQKTDIYIATGYPTYSYCFDDESEIYRLFASEVVSLKNPADPHQVMTAVSEAIFKYIGGAKVQGDDYSRMSLLKTSTQLDDGEKNKISVFKNSKMAWCVERASLAHQLFKFIGQDSKLVITTISNNGERQIHSFNLVKINHKTYLFDASVMAPADENGKYNPIAMVLPEDVFDKNMVGVEPLPDRTIQGASGRKYTIVYDLQNRELSRDAGQRSL